MPMAGAASEDDSGLMLPTAGKLLPVGSLTSTSRRPITIHRFSRFRPAEGAYMNGEDYCDDASSGDEDDSLSISDMDSGHDSSDQVLGARTQSNRDKEAN